MKIGGKEVVLVNDRVLIKVDKPEERTEAGLYLPQTAVEKAKVQTGRVVAVGPGIPVPTAESDDEPWKETKPSQRYLPLQAEVGDTALFLKEQAVDVKIEGQEYVVVPQSAIMLLLRQPLLESEGHELRPR